MSICQRLKAPIDINCITSSLSFSHEIWQRMRYLVPKSFGYRIDSYPLYHLFKFSKILHIAPGLAGFCGRITLYYFKFADHARAYIPAIAVVVAFASAIGCFWWYSEGFACRWGVQLQIKYKTSRSSPSARIPPRSPIHQTPYKTPSFRYIELRIPTPRVTCLASRHLPPTTPNR